MFERIACIGAVTLDRTVEPLGRLRSATSNPVSSRTSAGGTARNVAEALGRLLGGNVSLFSRVGSDAAGDSVLGELAALGVDLGGVDRHGDKPTASYTAVLDEAGELAMGLADMAIFDSVDERWLEPIVDSLTRHDLWVIDTNLPRRILESLVRHLPEGGRIFADPVSVDKSRRLEPILGRIDTIFPDRAEALEIVGARGAPGEWRDVGAQLLERGPRRAVITLGDQGVWVEDPPRHERVPAMATTATINVTGAGDCFLAGAIFAGTVAGPIDPVRCGLAAAALAVESARAVPRELTGERLLARYGAPR